MRFQILYFYCLLHLTVPCLSSQKNQIPTILKSSPASITARSSEENLQQQSLKLRMFPAPVTALTNSIILNLKDWRSRPELDKNLEQLFSQKKEEKQEEEA